MDDLISRTKVLNEIFEWVSRCENERPDAIKLLGERIRNIQRENFELNPVQWGFD